MKHTLLLFAVALLLSIKTFAQTGVAINTTGNEPDNSAMLDVSSTEKGMLVPRITKAQRDAIGSPATGLLIYQTDNTPSFYYYSGSNWVSLTGSGPGGNSPSVCIDYDGNAYPTFTIATQTWMAENLRVTKYRNGDAIPNVTDDAAWAILLSDAYCWYQNDQATNAKYGALYNWDAINDSRGLCPQGWHVPTDAEWTTLTSYLGGTSVAGGKMKSISALWTSGNTDATNNSGFSGLPGGLRSGPSGLYYNSGSFGSWWSSTAITYSQAWYYRLNYHNGTVNVFSGDKQDGFSVRCLRD